MFVFLLNPSNTYRGLFIEEGFKPSTHYDRLTATKSLNKIVLVF